MSRLTVGFAGATVLVRCADRRPLAALADRLAACDLAGPIVPDATATLDVEPQARGWRLSRDGVLLAADLQDDALLDWLVYEVTLALATLGPDRLLFHAAAVGGEGGGILLPGPSGSGKSTLAVWLAASGFELLSDELIAVDPDGLAMDGLRRPVNLKDEHAVVGHPAWPGGPAPVPTPTGSCRLTAVVFPRYAAGSAPSVQPLPPAAAAFRLLGSLTNRERWPGRGLEAVAGLVRQLPAFDLVYPDAPLAVDLLGALRRQRQLDGLRAVGGAGRPYRAGLRRAARVRRPLAPAR